jgi:hypothetical protein
MWFYECQIFDADDKLNLAQANRKKDRFLCFKQQILIAVSKAEKCSVNPSIHGKNCDKSKKHCSKRMLYGHCHSDHP